MAGSDAGVIWAVEKPIKKGEKKWLILQ